MAINWPEYEKREPNNSTDHVGPALKKMIDASMAQAQADYRALQLARAAEARRQRQESLDAAKILTTEHPCK